MIKIHPTIDRVQNILVFPCGSEIGLEIYDSLKNDIHLKLFGSSSVNDHGKFTYENYISDIPNVSDIEKFIEKINEVIEQYKIDFIFPAHDSVVLELARNRSKLKCQVLTSNFEACYIARSKKKTYETFKDIVPVPEMYNSFKDCTDGVVFLKPDVGQGSKGCYKATSEEEVNFYISKDPSLLILEYLPGEEITVDCFTQGGRLLYTFPRQRNRINNGISVNSSRYFGQENLQNIAINISSEMGLEGPWFFQVKRDKDGNFKLMEFAPRIAGTMGLSRVLGVNIPKLTIFNAMGIDASVLFNKHLQNTVVDRCLESKYNLNYNFDVVFIDFDDTIIINDKVNPKMIEFLYKCLNKDIKIFLITKHKKDIEQSLCYYKINKNIFSGITQIYEDLTKSDGIRYWLNNVNNSRLKNSIFIDDSFAERKKVLEELHIPVFDTDAIENLIF